MITGRLFCFCLLSSVCNRLDCKFKKELKRRNLLERWVYQGRRNLLFIEQALRICPAYSGKGEGINTQLRQGDERIYIGLENLFFQLVSTSLSFR